MNCRKARRQIIANDVRDDRGVAEHVANCPACRTTRDLTRALATAGEERRRDDLSPAKIAQTRARVSELLGQQAPAPWWYGLRRIALPLAATGLAGICAVVLWRPPQPGDLPVTALPPAPVPTTSPPPGIEQLDSRIKAKMTYLAKRIEKAREQPPRRRSVRSDLHRRSARLRRRIESCAAGIRAEIKSVEGSTSPLAPKNDPEPKNNRGVTDDKQTQTNPDSHSLWCDSRIPVAEHVAG